MLLSYPIFYLHLGRFQQFRRDWGSGQPFKTQGMQGNTTSILIEAAIDYHNPINFEGSSYKPLYENCREPTKMMALIVNSMYMLNAA